MSKNTAPLANTGTATRASTATDTSAPLDEHTPERLDRRAHKDRRLITSPLVRELFSLVLKIAVICAVVAIAFSFIYGIGQSMDADMAPTIKDGDIILYYRLDKNYRARDLLVISFQGKEQVRRVVATAGDTVDITEEGLVINGALQQEQDIFEATQRYADGPAFPITLGEGEVFVLADSRKDTPDSRLYGAVEIKDTQGTVISVIKRRDL
jgi:signal peptidase I